MTAYHFDAKESQIEQDYQLMSAFWQFWKTHDTVQSLDEDPFWDALLDDANEFAEQHPEPFARKLVVDLLRELERRAKEIYGQL